MKKYNRGIVTLAGGDVYFLNAYVNIKVLREEHKCVLPIEVFYLGDNDLPIHKREILELFNDVECIDLSNDINLSGSDFARFKGGWQAKTKAVIKSKFNEVLFLDSDSFPCSDPTKLFDDFNYIKYGSMFFYDMKTNKFSVEFLKKNYDFFYIDSLVPIQQIESGQFLVNKSICLDALIVADVLNQNPITYTLINGDKDTFLFGFLKTNIPININKAFPSIIGGVFIHYIKYEPMFCHLIVNAKLTFKANITYPIKYFYYHDKVTDVILELKKQLNIIIA